MKDLIKIFAVIVLFSSVALSQWEYKKVLIPETAASDSFKTPGDNFYLLGLQFPDTTDTGIGTALDSIWFMVSADPKNLGWEILSYENVVYAVKITSRGITLKLAATYPWEWWKIYFEDDVGDSVYFYPIFNDMDQ